MAENELFLPTLDPSRAFNYSCGSGEGQPLMITPNAIVTGDSSHMLKLVEANSVDLVVTSPPYADRRSKTYGGIKPDDYVDWFLPIADGLFRVLRPSGSFILNIKEIIVNGERHTYLSWFLLISF